MKLLKKRLVLFSPIIVLAVVLVIGLVLAPSVSPTPKNLPIAIVNEDQGVLSPAQEKVNMGDTIVKMVDGTAASASNEEPTVHWINVGSYDEVKNGLDDRTYYAALLIPKDFSAKQASLQTSSPSSPEIEIIINQGVNTLAAATITQILHGVADTINNTVRTQLLEAFTSQGATLTPQQASALAIPITKKLTIIHEVGTKSMNGNAPISLVQPLWIASIVGAVVIYLMANQLTFTNRIEKFAAQWIKILIGTVLALVAGFSLTWFVSLLGIEIPNFTQIGAFMSISFLAFFLLISAVLSWIGMIGIPMSFILLFFGAPLVAMTPEFMSTFYRDWIYSWLPIRFMVEGLRELFFFDQGLSWTEAVTGLVWIGGIGLVILVASTVKPSRKKEEKEVPSQSM